MDDTINNNQNPNLWISDTGASIHVTNDSNGIINRNRYRVDYLKYANKDKDIIEFYGDLLCRVINKENRYLNIIIRNVSYVPTCDTKLFSGTQVCNNYSMEGIITGDSMVYRNDDISLSFKRNSNSNLLLGFIQPLVGNYKLFSSKYLDINNIKVDINNFHDILGHPNERVLRNTAKSLDVSLLGTLDVCDS